MKTMTKRDIADIALVWILLNYSIDLISYLIQLGLTLGEPIVTPPENIPSINLPIYMKILELSVTSILILVAMWILVSKRNTLLDFFFPNAQEINVELYEETKILTEYSFWVRLVGIISLLSSIIWNSPKLFQICFIIPSLKFDISNRSQYVIYNLKDGLIPIIISAFVIWKADWIGEVLGKLGKSQLKKETGHPDET